MTDQVKTPPVTSNEGPPVRLLTVQDAAGTLGVSSRYIYERIRDGELATVDLGIRGGRQKLRIRADVLQRFIDTRTPAGRNVP